MRSSRRLSGRRKRTEEPEPTPRSVCLYWGPNPCHSPRRMRRHRASDLLAAGAIPDWLRIRHRLPRGCSNKLSGAPRSRFRGPHKAQDSALRRPAHYGMACRIIGALQDFVWWDGEPVPTDQCLIMIGLDAEFGSAAVGYRAAGDARTGHQQAAEPWPQRRVGVRWRLRNGCGGEQKRRQKQNARHAGHRSKSHA
jgi:hypothetical protein